MQSTSVRQVVDVLQIPVDVLGRDQAIVRIQNWADRHESRYVCFVNVHALVSARHTPDFSRVLRASDMNAPDGAPVAWMQRRMGYSAQSRIDGPDLMWRYCATAAERHESVFLYGSTPQTLERLQRTLHAAFPGLSIAGAHSPPFRESTLAEDEAVIRQINASGAGTVWVSLGCPRQEIWMSRHRGAIRATMIGVGAAFDFHAGECPACAAMGTGPWAGVVFSSVL